MRRHAQLFLCLIIAFWFGAGPILAVTTEEQLGEQFNFSVAPEERASQWKLALARFAVSKPKMSRDQAEAVLALMDIDDATFFEHSLAPEKRDTLAKQLSTFGKVFSYNDVLDFLLPFKNLRLWLTRNELMVIIATPVCNCDRNGDCTGGYSCQSVECISQAGSDAHGVCTPNAAVLEALEL